MCLGIVLAALGLQFVSQPPMIAFCIYLVSQLYCTTTLYSLQAVNLSVCVSTPILPSQGIVEATVLCYCILATKP